jgi:hypothetical protein
MHPSKKVPAPLEDLQNIRKDLDYEIAMFRTASRVLHFKLLGSEGFFHNAILESFLLHTRNLIDFFFGKDVDDDVVATHFLDHPKEIMKPDVLDISRKINKKLAHLTWTRIKEEKTEWQITEIATAMNTIIDQFEASVKVRPTPELLKAMLPLTGADTDFKTVASTTSTAVFGSYLFSPLGKKE